MKGGPHALDSVAPHHPAGLLVTGAEGADRLICCAGPYFALERWRVQEQWTHAFDGARILSNVGAPVELRSGDWLGTLPRGESLLLPAALGSIELRGPADVLAGYLPDLQRDIHAVLEAEGHPRSRIAALGSS